MEAMSLLEREMTMQMLTAPAGPIHEEGCRGGGQVPHDAQVDVRYGILPLPREREGLVRGQPEVRIRPFEPG